MHERTRKLQFDAKTRQVIRDRDEWCIFCKVGYKPPKYSLPPTDIMHIVPRSQGGLGVERNGVYGCRAHHDLLDHTANRKEMMQYIENYMKGFYPDWNREELYYRKGQI